MRTAIESLKLIKGRLAANPEIRKLIGGTEDTDIRSAITNKPELNMTKLNQEEGFNSYIALSFNKIEAFEQFDQYYLKVNVVVNPNFYLDPAEIALGITGEVIRELTTQKLDFAFANQFVFHEAEETYFDLDNKTWGYVLIFATDDSPISS